MIEPTEVRRARALSDPTRVGLFESLLAGEGPRSVAVLAEGMGLHHTVVRKHLRVLEGAGLVASEQLPVQGPGRPSVGWRAVPQSANPYQMLAGTLAEAVRSGSSPREAGRRVGQRLASRGQRGVEVIVAEAAKNGFEPRRSEHRDGRIHIVLDRCPFAAVAAVDPKVVCDVHHGLASGIASVCGDVVVERLDVRPPKVAGCRLVLRVA